MWAVATVVHNSELRCMMQLREVFVEAFVPLGKKITKPSRKKKPVVATFVLFPGYVFVRIDSDNDLLQISRVRTKMKFITYKLDDGVTRIVPIKDSVVDSLRCKSEIGDLFCDFKKEEMRKSFDRNQLVCWFQDGKYMLGFVAKNTQGKQYAHINVAQGEVVKIPVALLALL